MWSHFSNGKSVPTPPGKCSSVAPGGSSIRQRADRGHMSAIIALCCVAALIGIAALAAAIARFPPASPVIYGASLAVSLVALTAALWHLVANADAAILVLPLGLPGLGSHFRVDALAAFFLAVVNFGAAAASLYAIGYGPHERFP